MSKYTVNTEITKSLCKEFYDNSALTIEGFDPDSLDVYADYLDKEFGLKENAMFHVIYGHVMNDVYGLNNNQFPYPDRLPIIVIKLNDFVKPFKVVQKRFNFGGKLFDDVVNNNVHIEWYETSKQFV